MLTELIPKAAFIILALLILCRAEPAIDRMTDSTPWMIRWAFLLMAGGAIALLLMAFTPQVPGRLVCMLLAAGVALLLLCERRMRILLPPRRPMKNIKHRGQSHA
ncbi:MAG TPA: hypothetical protein VJ576_16145 [Rhodocyclaceae bacterium]|nr:hypothetical protein [Rhodocyclaceae bacterium]